MSVSQSLLVIGGVEQCVAPGLQITPGVKKAGWKVSKPVPCWGQEA